MAATLWEDSASPKGARQRMWNLTGDLRKALRSIGMGDVLVSQSKRLAVRADLLDCDYYRMLAGSPSARAMFRGEYMEQYSWAEATKARLLFG